jgi:hypothetical protein
VRTLGTVTAVLLALLWSALVWGGYGLLLWSTDYMAGSGDIADLSPDASAWTELLNDFLRDYGTAAAATLWAVGLLAILALRALYNWLVGLGTAPRRPEQPAPMPQQPPRTPEPVAAPPPPVAATEPAPPAASPQRWGRGAAPR